MHVRNGTEQAISTSYAIRNALIEEQEFIELKTYENDEMQRKTEIGREFQNYRTACRNITPAMYVTMLRRIIYSGHLDRNKYILSLFPDNNEKAIEFENTCA